MTTKTIEQIDAEVLRDEEERPHYEALEEAHGLEVKKQDAEYRAFIMGDKYNARIFGAKVEECLREIGDIDSKIDRYYENRETCGPDMKSWWMWMIDRMIDDKGREERNLRRYQFYRDVCLGKGDDGKRVPLDVDRAKEVPIQNFMPTEPKNRSSKRLYYCCPLHEEKTPSFVVYTDQNSYACYGGCGGIGGDNIDLFMRLNNCDFVSAVKALNKL